MATSHESLGDNNGLATRGRGDDGSPQMQVLTLTLEVRTLALMLDDLRTRISELEKQLAGRAEGRMRYALGNVDRIA
jgi:hypothetical protein